MACPLLNICNHFATTELLETVTRLLTDCSRLYPDAYRNTAENLIVHFELAVYSARLSLVWFIRLTEMIK